MEQYKIDANELFFCNVLLVLREGGKWGWPDTGHFFTKSGGKLLGSPAALEDVHNIVSKNFFKKYFGILEINS